MSKSYAAGHFELAIYGHKTTTYLKSVEGGWAKGNFTDDPMGGDNKRSKHLATIETDPIAVEFGMAGASQVLEWIQSSWNRKFTRRNGQVTHANFDLKSTYETWFYNALITETTFPTLDGAAKEGSYIKVKFQPETVSNKQGTLQAISGQSGVKQKMWMPSSFRITLDQFDGMEYTNKIDSFTIKQGIKKNFTGVDRFPEIEPTKIEFPNITGTIALGYADKLLKWHEDYIVNGKKDRQAQMTGAIEFLSPDRKSTLFRINLADVGLASAQIVQSTANQDQIKRVKYELFVGSMTLEGSLGMD